MTTHRSFRERIHRTIRALVCLAVPFSISILILISTARADPAWIWSSKDPAAGEKIRCIRPFSVDGDIKTATLLFTCDNEAVVRLNGKEVARTDSWETPIKADVSIAIVSGRNELRVDAANHGGPAGLLTSLTLEDSNGKKRVIESDAAWTIASKPAVVVAAYGDAPWGDVLDRSPRGSSGRPEATDPETIITLPGFAVERLHSVPKSDQGSWVCLTVDPRGRLIAGDQYGGFFRITPPPPGASDPVLIEPLQLPIEGGAHGLLFAFDSLYAMVNEKSGKGLWRLRDTDGDDQFDEATHLRTIEGGGEHGPHAVVPGPDGKSLYIAAGNHTRLPEGMEESRAARIWGEDHILPRMWDANGHARGILAPGGYIAKTDPDGRVVELFTSGFRNHFDIAFDGNGELFTYDSDMEWDLGAPWYRPTRVFHCTSGAESGWRSGSGKWPDYYPDNLPSVLDIGPGSPTGVVVGTGARFPAKYQRALFINDWTYGTMYAIHLKPKGASFIAEKEEFLSGRPLPLTDLLIHPLDGAMYFAIGGRRTQSGLYRVTYTGDDPTDPVPPIPPTPEARLRHRLETLHTAGTGREAIEQAWPFLGHPDRHVRFAARVAIERQPADLWAERALAEPRTLAVIEAIIALARTSEEGSPLLSRALQSLGRVNWRTSDTNTRLALLRAHQLCLIRMGPPADADRTLLLDNLEPAYPDMDPRVTRELCQLLVALKSPMVVAKTLELMVSAADDHQSVATDSLLDRNAGYGRAARDVHASRPNGQQIMYLYSLQHATAGWTPALRQTYFSWFPHTRQWKGGNSFAKFLENIRRHALDSVAPDSERDLLDRISSKAAATAIAQVNPPRGPGRDYSLEDVLELTGAGLQNRNLERGRELFTATACLSCHRFAGDGGGLGPDLTGAASRYTMRDLVENIVDPSRVISDQYNSEQIRLRDGSVLIGRVVPMDSDRVAVMTNPFAPNDLIEIEVREIVARRPHDVSLMPRGLINALNPDELKDLLAYILSGGNPDDSASGR